MKIINWLLQQTQDGATYLQAIILITILCVLIFALAINIRSLIRDLGEGVVLHDKEKM